MVKRTRKQVEKIGNAGCKKCGLRASSKNVMFRHVFPIWPDDDLKIQYMEHSLQIITKDDRDYVFVNPCEGINPARAMAVWFKEVHDHNPAKYEANVKKLLCLHDWRQDRGTATV